MLIMMPIKVMFYPSFDRIVSQFADSFEGKKSLRGLRNKIKERPALVRSGSANRSAKFRPSGEIALPRGAAPQDEVLASRTISQWSIDEVAAWLVAQGLTQHIALFRESEIGDLP